MTRKFITIFVAGAIIACLVFLVGCESDAQTGAAVGALAGAGIGQLAGKSTESTLIGAAVGGGAGAALDDDDETNGEDGDPEGDVSHAQLHAIDCSATDTYM